MKTNRDRLANTSLECSWVEVVFDPSWSEQPVELLYDFVFECVYRLPLQQPVIVSLHNLIVYWVKKYFSLFFGETCYQPAI